MEVVFMPIRNGVRKDVEHYLRIWQSLVAFFDCSDTGRLLFLERGITSMLWQVGR